jgi:cytochrome c oxidase assembly protein subunit 11
MDNQPTTPQLPTTGRPANLRRDAVVAAICGLVVVLMVGAS